MDPRCLKCNDANDREDFEEEAGDADSAEQEYGVHHLDDSVSMNCKIRGFSLSVTLLKQTERIEESAL